MPKQPDNNDNKNNLKEVVDIALKDHIKKYGETKSPLSESLVKNNTNNSSVSANKGMLIASELIAGPITGTVLGYLLEIPLPSLSPFGLIGGFILGTVSAFYSVIKQASQWEQQIKIEKEKRKNLKQIE